MQGWIIKIVKFPLYLLLGIIALLLLVFLVLQIPYVQNKIISAITRNLSEKTNSKIVVESGRYYFFNEVSLKGVYLEDRQNDTILYAGDISAEIDLLKLFKRKIVLNELSFENSYLNLYRKSGQEDFNVDFFIEAFQDTSQKTSKWNFDIEKIKFSNVALDYLDAPAGTSMDLRLPLAFFDVNNLDFEDYHSKLTSVKVEGALLALKREEAELTSEKEKTGEAGIESWTFSIQDIQLTQSLFIYDNCLEEPNDESAIDYNHLSLSGINVFAKDFYLYEDQIKSGIKHLSFRDKSGFALNDFKGNFYADNSLFNFTIQKLLTPHSDFKGDLSMTIPFPIEKENIGDIFMRGRFYKELIGFRDVNYFVSLEKTPSLKDEILLLAGNLEGKIKNFEFNQLYAKLNSGNYVKGNFLVKGLPKISQTYGEATISDAYITIPFIKPYLGTIENINISALKELKFSGSIKGNVYSPNANLKVNTALGSLSSDLSIIMDQDWNIKQYHGNFSSGSFHFGKLLTEVQDLERLSINANVSGFGKDIQKLKASIGFLEYKGYSYNNITINGSLINEIINASANFNDSNLQGELFTTINLKKYEYKVKGNIGIANFCKTGLTEVPLAFKAEFLHANLKGKSIDSLSGRLYISDLSLLSNKGEIFLDSILAVSFFDRYNHYLQVRSGIFNANLSGDYSFAELPMFAAYLGHEYFPELVKEEVSLEKTERINFDFDSKDISEIGNLFHPDIQVLKDVNVSFVYNQSPYEFKLNASVNKLKYKDKELESWFFNSESEKREVKFISRAASITFNENLLIKDSYIKGKVVPGKVEFQTKMENTEIPASIDLNGILSIQNDTFAINFPFALFDIKGHEWNLHPENQITFSKDYLDIDNFMLEQEEQKIIIRTSGLTKREIDLFLQLQNLRLGDIAALTGNNDYHISGRLNGNIEAYDLSDGLGIQAKLKTDSLMVNNELMGELFLSASKEKFREDIYFSGDLSGRYSEVTLNGNYVIKESDDSILANLQVKRLSLHPLGPFVKDILFLMEGTGSGNFQISGLVSEPSVTGNLIFSENTRAGMKVTQTIYKIPGQGVRFNENSIQLDKLVIIDSLNRSAIADGFIYHDGFKDFRFDLTVSADNFQLINTDYKPEVPFYGKVMVAMNIGLNGPLETLQITTDVKTLSGTKVFVPLAAFKEVTGLPAYIRLEEIETEKDTIDQNQKPDIKKQKVNFAGFNVKGSLKVTKEAEVNLIVDPVNRDNISARGSGEFNLSFDSQNQLNLFGTYTIDSGAYHLSFINLVRRSFSIEKGSTISWAGDFEDADLDITGVYETNASRFDLIEGQTGFMSDEQVRAAQRPLPVHVYLFLTGDLLSPELSFDIRIPEGEGIFAGNLVVQQINEIKNNPNELNKQVFSLIVLNRFAGPTVGESIAGSGIAVGQVNQSVSRFLNEQLNRITDINGGIELDVGIESLDASDRLFAQRARLKATREVTERLSVSVGGTVDFNTPYASSQFAGDYNVLYGLNENGTINLKLFRRDQQNIYNNNINTLSGFSINFRREFNKWKNIF